MEYAREVLARSAKLERRRGRNKRFVESVDCAYCRGTGVDPKYANMSKCPVCGTAGKIKVKPPVVTCLKCRGTGREGGELTCLACRGIGVVSVPQGCDHLPQVQGNWP